MPNVTNLTPPRVPLVDENGFITREWYRFLFNQYILTGSGSNDISLPALAIMPLPQPTNSPTAPEQAVLAAPTSDALLSQIAELQKQLDSLKLQVYPQLGTMAALQQANLPWVTFDTTPQGVPTGAAAAGTLYWDNADAIKTLNLIMEDTGNVVQHIGEETYYRVKATSAINEGQVVMFTGTVGASGGLKGAPATGLTATQNEYVMGVATEDIPNNQWGYVTWFGEVKKINTTGTPYGETWADGDILYYNPAIAGGLTKNVPTAPNPKVIVATVVHAATNGILFVRPTFGSALGATDSNVQITSLANNDILQYKTANSRWENVTPASVIAGAGGAPVIKTADFTVATNETWLINNKSGSTCTVTLPTASANTGRVLTFQNYQDQLLVSASSNVVPLGGGAAGTAILDAITGNWATLVSNGSNWIMMQEAPNNVMLV